MPNDPQVSAQPAMPKSQTLGLLIALIVLVAVGFIALYFKLDLETSKLKSDISTLKTVNEVMGGKMGMMEEKLGRVETGTMKKKVVQETQDALTYGPLGSNISLKTETIAFPYNTPDLLARAEECGTNTSKSTFDVLVDKYKDAKGTRYTFTYLEPSQGPTSYVVTVFPNLMQYRNLDSFKEDFDLCAAGGNDYPELISDSFIGFISSCGSGFNDGSGRPIGCTEVSKIIEPSLKLR